MAFSRKQLEASGADPAWLESIPEPKKRHKYGAVATTVDGIRFHSKREARRWGELQLMLKAGEITKLERQVKFPLYVMGVKIGFYIADFRYFRSSQLVVEDAKGVATPLYKWKKRHFEAEYGIRIVEV